MSRMRRIAPLLIGLTGAFSACSNRAPAQWQGYVEGEFVLVGSSQAGKLTGLSVARGQRVRQGAPLFALDLTDETAALAQARAQLTAARAQLADIATGKRAPEVNVNRAQLGQAEANAHKAALQLARDEIQFRAGGIPKGQLDDDRANADATAAQVVELRNQVDVARLPAREEQIRAQHAQVAAAEANVAQAQWKLDEKTVSAPAAGAIYDTLYRVGEWVQAGDPVVKLLPAQNIKVRFFVSETVLGTLTTGRSLSIHCDGCASDVPATITYLSSEAEYTPPVIYSNESREKLVFLVEAHPSAQDAPRLHPGQPVTVTLR